MGYLPPEEAFAFEVDWGLPLKRRGVGAGWEAKELRGAIGVAPNRGPNPSSRVTSPSWSLKINENSLVNSHECPSGPQWERTGECKAGVFCTGDSLVIGSECKDRHKANPLFLELCAAIIFMGNLFNKVDAYFSSFRRCNYPRVSSAGVVEIVQECGRYSRFWDIPSPWWQATTILVGVASGLSLLVGVTAAAACCVSYVVHSGTARAAGFLQLCAALMVSSGVALYPIGWDNREIKESCGESAHVYKIGNCNVSWSAYLLLGAVTLLLFCFGLSFCASRIKPGGSFRI